MEMVKNAMRLLGVIMRKQILTGSGMSEVAEALLGSISRAVERDPVELFDKMLHDIYPADSVKADETTYTEPGWPAGVWQTQYLSKICRSF
jgi:hypothetical protein